MNPDEVIAALTGLIQTLQGYQTAHKANIASANAPVVAATQALTDAQTAVVTAQGTLDAATTHAAGLVAAETASENEDQTAITAANSLITQLGGTPVPDLTT